MDINSAISALEQFVGLGNRAQLAIDALGSARGTLTAAENAETRLEIAKHEYAELRAKIDNDRSKAEDEVRAAQAAATAHHKKQQEVSKVQLDAMLERLKETERVLEATKFETARAKADHVTTLQQLRAEKIQEELALVKLRAAVAEVKKQISGLKE